VTTGALVDYLAGELKALPKAARDTI